MPILTLAGQKGGTGKTTLSANLAVAAAQAGSDVILVDTDPQGSLAAWWNRRSEELGEPGMRFLNATPAELPTVLPQYASSVVIIDSPPSLSQSVHVLAQISDLLLIPCGPSQLDIDSNIGTVDVAEKYRARMGFVCNGAAHRARLATETVSLLSEFGPVAPVIIHRRTEFAIAATAGLSVLDTNPEGPSASEVRALWEFVTRLIERGNRRG